MTSNIYFNVASWFPEKVYVKPHFNTQWRGRGGMFPPLFFTFRHLWLAIEDDPAILLRSLLQTRKSFNFFLMTTWQSSLYYTNVPLHIRFRKKFHSSFKLFAWNPQFIPYDDNRYFVSEIVLICCEKKCCGDRENLLKYKAKKLQKNEITRTIYSNSIRSEQFLKQNVS